MPRSSRELPLINQIFGGYSHRHVPLGAYGALAVLFHAVFGGFLLATKGLKRSLPERIELRDLLLFGVATHKLSRTITRDWVTSFLRAPFVRLEGEAELPKEVSETERGRGLRRAIGQVITCPFCTGQWVAALMTYLLVLQPRVARLIASIFAIVTISDFLHAIWVFTGTKMEQAGTSHESDKQEPQNTEEAQPASPSPRPLHAS